MGFRQSASRTCQFKNIYYMHTRILYSIEAKFELFFIFLLKHKAWLYIKLSFGSITVLLCYYSLFAYIWFVRLFSNFKPFFQHYNRLFLLN